MKRQVLALCLSLFTAFAIITVTAAPAAAQSQSRVAYRVQPGDSLAKIARQYCTTWEEIYRDNRSVIGPDPNVVEPGTILYILPRCGGGNPPSGPSGVYDRGPRMYASGTVVGNVYTVAYGDTLYSIAGRFGLAVNELARANGITDTSKVYAGQRLIIPGLSSGSRPPSSSPYVTIDSPRPGTYLPRTFTVSGSGGGLIEGNVIVRIEDVRGNLLTQKATVLQGKDVGIGGTGSYSVQMTVDTPPNTPGGIVVTSDTPGTRTSGISVYFNRSGSSGP